jgi:hypothetical protein
MVAAGKKEGEPKEALLVLWEDSNNCRVVVAESRELMDAGMRAASSCMGRGR